MSSHRRLAIDRQRLQAATVSQHAGRPRDESIKQAVMSIFGEVQNINDESRREYQGISSRLFADEIYSWTALLGMTYAF